MARDEIVSGEADIKMLMNATADTEGVVSDGDLNRVRIYLDKVSEVGGLSQEVNHDLLQTVFKRLQAWSVSPALRILLEIGIVRNLATIYDSFKQTDYSRSEVLTSMLELLFVIEDMSDSSEGKIQCGKFFLFRLLALATATVEAPSVKLQRAAVETICALVTRSPENQQAVLDQTAECYKLFRVFLPRCGDFQQQGSITEIFYRLAKRGPQVLEFMPNKAVRKSMESLLQSKHPNLLSDIRSIVTLINESLGHVRSVYSFLAERISINGQKMNTADKWVNFGRTQLSFYVVGLTELTMEPSMMDVQYQDIVEIKRSSPSVIEVLVQDRPESSAFKALGLESGTSTVMRIQVYFNEQDSSAIEATVLPKILPHASGRQDKLASKTLRVDTSTNKGSKGVPFNKALPPTYTPGDRLLPSTPAERRCPNDKSSSDCFHISLDYVSDTPQDPNTPERVRAAIAPDHILTMEEARAKMNHTLQETKTDGPKDSKLPGRHAHDSRQHQVTALSSTFEPLGSPGQSFPRRQEDHQFQKSNVEPTDAYQRTKLAPPVGSQVNTVFSRRTPIAGSREGNISENRRASKPSHIITQNLIKDLSGPKTRSPSDENLRARVPVHTDDETTDEMDKNERVSELRMKQRHDPQYATGMQSEPPRDHGGKSNLVRNNCQQVNNAELAAEAQRCTMSSEKNLTTPPRDMLASDSVMTDIREKRIRTAKGAKSGRGRPSKAALSSAARHGENGENLNVCRTVKKRTCKKPTTYFDADDDNTSAASDGSTEFVVTRQKKSRGTAEDPVIINTKRSAQTVAKSERCSVPKENRATTVSRRNVPSPDEHPCAQRASTVLYFSRQGKASHERKVACASNSRNEVVEDVFCFTANPGEERNSRKTPSNKARRDSDYITESCRKRKKMPEVESHHVMSISKQRSCSFNGPRLVIPDRQPAPVKKKSPAKAFPAVSPPTKQTEVTPHPQEPRCPRISSSSDYHTRPPVLQAQKTYTKSDKIITKSCRLERWKSSMRKLELPTVDATSQDESSDEAITRKTSYVQEIEVEDAADSDDSSGIVRISKLLKNFKQKVKLVEKNTVEDILSKAMRRVQQEIHSTDEKVRGEKTELMHSCKEKYGKLENELQGHIQVMQATYEKYQRDFAQHLKRQDAIVGEIEGTNAELNDLAKQQGQEHKEVLAKLKDSCNRLLTEADEKVLEVRKSSSGMRGLKEALQGILKDL